MEETTKQTPTAPATPIPPAQQTPEKKKFSITKLIRTGISVLLLAAMAVLLFNAKAGFDTRMDIVKSDKVMCDTEYCLKATVTHKGGMLTWSAIKGVSILGFSMSTNKTYAENQEVVLTCPVDYTSSQNALFVKVGFMLDSSKLQKCK